MSRGVSGRNTFYRISMSLLHKKRVKYFKLIYELLLAEFGPQHWWPAESRFEIIVGAVLIQNTNWLNAKKAIINLKQKDLLTFEVLSALSQEELASYIRPCGYYNLKAKRLLNLLQMIHEKYEGNFEKLFLQDFETARNSLLSVKGIGPETADCILLYCGEMPVFVVDAYTHRIFSRHCLVEEESDYHSLQEYFMNNLEHDVQLFNEYHALIVQMGKTFCKKSKPLCEQCPLQGVNGYPG